MTAKKKPAAKPAVVRRSGLVTGELDATYDALGCSTSAVPGTSFTGSDFTHPATITQPATPDDDNRGGWSLPLSPTAWQRILGFGKNKRIEYFKSLGKDALMKSTKSWCLRLAVLPPDALGRYREQAKKSGR